jgi:sugar lactone lactonase YvrE
MNQRIEDQLFDLQLAAWLSDEAGAHSPAYLDETLARVDGVGQRRVRAGLERWLPMSVITARPVSAPWRLAWTALILSLVALVVASLVIVGSLVDRSDDSDPTLRALIPTLRLEETWDTTMVDGLDEPMVGGVDADGNVYLVNGGSNEVLVLDPTGRIIQRHGASNGAEFQFQDHPDDPYGFSSNGSVAVASDGTLYVASIVDRRIYRFTQSDGWSSWGGVGTGDGQFLRPSKVTVAPDGTVHVRDGQRKDIQQFDPEGTYLGKTGRREAPDGTEQLTGFIAFDDEGGSYVAAYDQDRLQSWAPDGNLRWSVEVRGSSEDEFTHPRDVAVDVDGNVYVTHTGVELFSPEGGLLSEWVPPGEPTEVGMGPLHVAAGSDGTIYVSVQMLDTIHRLKVAMADGEPLGAPPSPRPALASPAGPAAAVAPRQASMLSIPVDDFTVPFDIEVPQGSWGVHEVGPSFFQARSSQPTTGDPALVSASIVADVFTDPCHPGSSRMAPSLGPSVEDLVDVLGRLEGFRVIEVRDVELDGHRGKAIDLENTIDASACGSSLWLPQWTYVGSNGNESKHGPPGDTYQRIFVLDVDGQRVVLERWTLPYTAPETIDEADRVLESIDFR